ncbi:MAG: hypothetical protein LUE93_05105 [Bacteroides sp.]|nr:hypothetical protein [Bacteroides sp.]
MKKLSYILQSLLYILPALLVPGCSDDNTLPDFEGVDAYITGFKLTKGGTIYKASMLEDEIIVTIPASESLTEGVTAEIRISENAGLSPDPSTITNWEEEHQFIVTAYNQSRRIYHYKIERETVSVSGDITLTSQSEVDAFAASLAGIIEGSLTIGKESGGSDNDSIRDLSALTTLKRVKHNLVINPTFAGENLQGLNNLQTVGALSINNPPHLREVDLRNLLSVNLELSVYGPAITNLNFRDLESISDGFDLNTPLLTALQMDELTYLGASLTLSGLRNTALETVALPKLVQLKGDLSLTLFTALNRLNLSALESVNNLSFTSLYNLASIDLPALNNIEGTLTLSRVESLKELRCPELTFCKNLSLGGTIGQYSNLLSVVEVPKLERVNSISINSFCYGSLQELGFPHLKEVNNSLSVITSHDVQGSPVNIESIEAPLLTTVEGDLTIEANSTRPCLSLQTLNFSSLSSVKGRVTIHNQSILNNFETFKNLIPHLEASNWSVSNCGYNPTYQDMEEGHYSAE